MWPVGRWARPVINVTVPIQSLMGLTDSPGVLAGGESIPAALVRRIAADPDSTWYRMLTDPARECVELSTTSYRPTGPIWRQTVAAFNTCYAPVCTVPATEAEIDHLLRWPEGETATGNLGPGCKGHHTAKHAPGFGLRRGQDGRLELITGAGFSHPVQMPEQPVADFGEGTCAHRVALLDLLDTLADDLPLGEVLDALADLVAQRTAAGGSWLRQEVDQLRADYRASYPDATDDDIHAWIHDDDPTAPEPPPITRHGEALSSILAREKVQARPGAFPWDRYEGTA